MLNPSDCVSSILLGASSCRSMNHAMAHAQYSTAFHVTDQQANKHAGRMRLKWVANYIPMSIDMIVDQAPLSLACVCGLRQGL